MTTMPTASPRPNVRPFVDGAIDCDGTTWSNTLKGGRCRQCGLVTLPAKQVCPACWSRESQEQVALSRVGRLYAYTIVRNPPPGANAPYAIAYVDLPENIRLMVRADAETVARLALDSDVAVEVGPIGEDDEGIVVVGPVLREIGGEEGGS